MELYLQFFFPVLSEFTRFIYSKFENVDWWKVVFSDYQGPLAAIIGYFSSKNSMADFIVLFICITICISDENILCILKLHNTNFEFTWMKLWNYMKYALKLYVSRGLE